MRSWEKLEEGGMIKRGKKQKGVQRLKVWNKKSLKYTLVKLTCVVAMHILRFITA